MDKFSDLTGKTLTLVQFLTSEWLEEDDFDDYDEAPWNRLYLMRPPYQYAEQVVFEDTEGNRYRLYSPSYDIIVTLDSVIGDVNDVVFTPILEATKYENVDNPPPPEDRTKGSWIVFKLHTIKGSLQIQYYGLHAGWVNEELFFEKMKDKVDD